MEHFTTIMLALDLYRVPSRVRLVRAAPLPNGIDILLRLAGGEEEVTRRASAATAVPASVLRDAAGFFIEQAMLFPEADSYRILGVRQGAATAELRRNMALLLRWLHPDHGLDLRTVFTHRITRAWDDLKTEERRSAYDRRRRVAHTQKSLERKKVSANRASPALRKIKNPKIRGQAHRPRDPSLLSLFRRVVFFLTGRPVY